MRIENSSSMKDVAKLQPVHLEPDVSKTSKASIKDPLSNQAGKEQPTDLLASILKDDNFSSINFNLSFHIHKETNQLVAKVLDPQTNKVIREIPPEEMLKLAENLNKMIGLFFDKRV